MKPKERNKRPTAKQIEFILEQYVSTFPTEQTQSDREEWLRDGIEPKKPDIDEDIEYGQICANLGITDPRAKQIILNYGRFSLKTRNCFGAT